MVFLFQGAVFVKNHIQLPVEPVFDPTLCQQHLGFLRKGDLVIFDRYYASHFLFSVLSHKGVHFLFRMRGHSWNCVQEFIASGLTEQVVKLKVYKYSKVAKKIPGNVKEEVCVRLIKQVAKSGNVRVYATSLLDGTQYKRKSVIALYKQRWGVEEAYKTLKARLNTVHFSGITIHAVQQDFYANVFLVSLTSVLKANLKPKLTKTRTDNKENRIPIINNTFAMAQTKRLLVKIYFCFDEISQWIQYFLNLIASAVEYSRKGQSNPRIEYKGYNRGCSQNYKFI